MVEPVTLGAEALKAGEAVCRDTEDLTDGAVL